MAALSLGLLALAARAASAAALHPTVVVEEHHHALPYWYDAARRSAAATPGGGTAGEMRRRMLLVHIDTHDDLALPRSGSFAPWDAAAPDGATPQNIFASVHALCRSLRFQRQL